jgi:sulfide:quinone oxidoreductase
MKTILILGAGTGGTIMANKLCKDLRKDEWQIVVAEKENNHYYQPGFLFLPFGQYSRKRVTKKTKSFLPSQVKLITSEATNIDKDSNTVSFKNNDSVIYDILIIATGVRIAPEDTPGLKDKLWYHKIFDFYTIDGAVALSEFIKTWKGGKFVINIADNPIKCPVAPLELAFYADEYFVKKGIREKVEITYVTPMSGAFTKPKAAKAFGDMLTKKGINLVPDFFIGEVDNEKSIIKDFGGREVEFDCLVTIPLHAGDPVVLSSGLSDEFGFVKANKFTMQSVIKDNVFVIGDAVNFPTSKAGSVVHFQADVLHENILHYIKGEGLKGTFDGHSNCFVETGFGKALLIDFNYDTEPLPGKFPMAAIGPLGLLKESRLNHFGKLAFEWIYWHILLKARWLPISNKMSMKGKKIN